jgi:hypothetical protein
MHELYELKEKLCKELEEYGGKEDLTAGSLEVIDKLAHAVKNIGKVIEMYEEDEYSNSDGPYRDGMTGNMGGGSYARDGRRNGRGGTYRGRYEGGYARGRGRNAKRDSMGRYSSEGYSRADGMDEMVDSIRSMMNELPPDVQRDAQRFVDKLEQQMM